ncbi:MAG: N-acetyl-gamma-glutamyl-phosphate reductase [Blastocatellia bacterium]
MGELVRTVVAGATGYAGRELIRLISSHRGMKLIGAFASRGAETTPLTDIHPQLRGVLAADCQAYDEKVISALEPDLVFLATPNEFSHEVVPPLLESGATVVDLSGSFRLRDGSLYPQFYGFEHRATELLGTAVYGMTELVRRELPGARLIANPGCYPTSIILPVRPLIAAGLIDESQPVISDSKSGVTGAGKSPSATTHFVEVSESLRAYNLFRHRHGPEISQGLGLPPGGGSLVFSPHLLPINRGILSTIYLRLRPGIRRSDILDVWRQNYSDSPLIRIFDGAQLPEIKFVAGLPFCDFGGVVDDSSGQAIIVAAIDNLLKGAASQAIQNANLALGFDEMEGLR